MSELPSDTHPGDEAFVLWAAGELDKASALLLEVHVRACPACAKRLQAEAKLELDVRAIAREVLQLPPAPSAPRATRESAVRAISWRRRSLAAATAAAATVLMGVGYYYMRQAPIAVTSAADASAPMAKVQDPAKLMGLCRAYADRESDANDWDRQRFDKAGIPYLHNDYGTWIGLTSFGTSWEVYVVAELAGALYSD